MQKIQSYLYPNRVIVIADLAGFTTENTIVYAKDIKIYKGVDNVIQFDIQNADQKRLELITSPLVSSIYVNVMDQNGIGLPNSPYAVTPSSTIKGIATITIPASDLVNIAHQSLKYSVTGTDTSGNHIPLYTDSRFSAVGVMKVVESATAIARPSMTYDQFAGEINFMGNVTNHSPAIPCKFYEAVATSTMTFTMHLTNFVGNVYLEGTEDMTIAVSSFSKSTQIQSYNTTVPTTTTITFTNIPVGIYNYFRVSWQYPNIWSYGASGQDPTQQFGSVDKIVVTTP
jgi:hypothetical protein